MTTAAYFGTVAVISLLVAWIVPGRTRGFNHEHQPEYGRETSIRRDLHRLQKLQDAWLSATTFQTQITTLSALICNLNYTDYPQELEKRLKCAREVLIPKLTAIAEEYSGRLHEEAHRNRTAFNELMLLLEGYSDVGRALYNAQIWADYPADWPELVARHIEDPSIVDFGYSISYVQKITEHEFARRAKAAVEDRDPVRALILLAYCKADPSKRAKLGARHAQLTRLIEQSRQDQSLAAAA